METTSDMMETKKALHDVASIVNQPSVSSTHGEGIYTGSWDFDSDKPHGQGRMEYFGGGEHGLVSYEGNWFQGDWSGFGTLVAQPTSDDQLLLYQGNFLDNRKHGVFVIRYADGRIYDGEFNMNVMGKGTMTYHNNGQLERYWGYFDGQQQPHGRGKGFFCDGSIYDGEWSHGVREGHGRMTYSDGTWYLGEWMQDARSGLGIQAQQAESKDQDRLVHSGCWYNDRPVQVSSFPSREERWSSCEHLVYYRNLLSRIPQAILLRHQRRQSVP